MKIQKIQTVEEQAPEKITQAEHAAAIFRAMVGDDIGKKEYFLALTLDSGSRPIVARVIHIGTLNQSLVHPREVFRDAITDGAAAVIVAHNHPSGNTSPSQNDDRVTRRLREAGELLGIELLDHLIITPDDGYYSYSEEGGL